MKLLVIDDNQKITDAFADYCHIKNHECVQSNSGENALQLIIDGGNFDGILLDLAMPSFSGLRIIEGIEKSDPEILKKVIIFSASEQAKEQKNIFKQKNITFLKKPAQPSEIMTMFQNKNQ